MYVIYHIKSTMQVGPTKHGYPHTAFAKIYKTAGAAARTCAKFNAQSPAIYNGQRVELPAGLAYGWCHVNHYRARVVHMVTRTNMMSGKEYQEPSNTPGYCSPSSEAYWSM